MLGFDEGMETLHYLLESAFCEGANGAELSLPFLRDVENSQHFETNPIFAVLHEMCYTQQAASRWSAHRDSRRVSRNELGAGTPPSFTGEMIYPWMFDEYKALVPLREVADAAGAAIGLADALRSGAARGQPDSVRRRRSTPTTCTCRASTPSPPPRPFGGMKTWITNEFEHNGLRTDGERVFGRLLDLVRNRDM